MKKLITMLLIMTLLLPAMAHGESTDVTGKWSMYVDATRLSDDLRAVFQYDLLVYDLYLFRNGAAYMTKLDIKKGTNDPDFSYGALSGIWIGDAEDMTVRVADQTFKAKISDDGYLLLYITEKLPFPMVKVETTDRFYKELTQ